MYGVPTNLSLAVFRAATLNQIALGKYELQFHFSSHGSISVEGQWDVYMADGHLLDKAIPHEQRDTYRLHTLLGEQVVADHVNAPHAFSLTFSNGAVLTIYDSSHEYETVSIQPGDIVI